MISVGYECGAHGAHVFTSRHFLFLPYTECLINFGRLVAEQNEWEFVLVGEFNMACRRILADADYLVSLVAQILVAVAQRACFCRASGGVVFWIKVDDEWRAFEVRGGHLLAIAVNAKHRGNYVAYVHSVSTECYIILYCGVAQVRNGLRFCNAKNSKSERDGKKNVRFSLQQGEIGLKPKGMIL